MTPRVKLFLAGWLVFLAGIESDYHRAWIVWAMGLAMVTASLIRPLMDGRSAPLSCAHATGPGHSPAEALIERERGTEPVKRRGHAHRSVRSGVFIPPSSS